MARVAFKQPVVTMMDGVKDGIGRAMGETVAHSRTILLKDRKILFNPFGTQSDFTY